MIRVGLVGLGYWGPNLARVLNQARNCSLAACCDVDPKTHTRVTRQYPTVRVYEECSDMWDSVDAVMIATPISTHFRIAAEAIKQGKHVFVEKPLAQTSRESEELISLANRDGLTLMTGHTFAYSPA